MHLGQRNMKVICIALFTVSIAAAIEFNYEAWGDHSGHGSFCGTGIGDSRPLTSQLVVMSLQCVVMVTEFCHRYHYQVVTFTSQFLQCRESSPLFQNLGFNGWDGTVDGA